MKQATDQKASAHGVRGRFLVLCKQVDAIHRAQVRLQVIQQQLRRLSQSSRGRTHTDRRGIQNGVNSRKSLLLSLSLPRSSGAPTRKRGRLHRPLGIRISITPPSRSGRSRRYCGGTPRRWRYPQCGGTHRTSGPAGSSAKWPRRCSWA